MNQNTRKNIVLNKKMRFDYHLFDRAQAGISLLGWEVKSLREGRVQLGNSYIHFSNGEAFLEKAIITPLITAGHNKNVIPERRRKLLLTRKELEKLSIATQQKGYSCVCIGLYWKKHLIKCEIALARGKKLADKRDASKKRDWERQQQHLLKNQSR